jgi:salicylate hydroxylase
VAESRTILVAGGGIAGLTTALALARKDFRAVVLEQAEELEEAGAGIQLPPNATRILLALGLGDALKSKVVAPEAIAIRSAHSGREIVRIPLGKDMETQYGAPYWTIHRGDLQAALFDAVENDPDTAIKLAARVEDFEPHGHGLTVHVRSGSQHWHERGIALVGTDGLWSVLGAKVDRKNKPRFAQRSAWRATLPASEVSQEFRAPLVQLWLGHNAHLVHYPVRGGNLINIVAIVRDAWQAHDWSAAGARDEILSRFSKRRWAVPARALLSAPQTWLKWALYDRPVRRRWGNELMTLVGDAAHPMLPFLAQGAAMAMEDAVTLADCLAEQRDDLASAMRRYEDLRRGRTARVQQAARSNGKFYHLSWPAALARNLSLRAMGGERLRGRYDWLYDWRLI